MERLTSQHFTTLFAYTFYSLSFFLFSQTAIAQCRFESGTIFLSNGDSLQVLIDVIKTENNFNYCYYHTPGSKEEQSFAAEDINGFTLDNSGRRFIKKTIEVDGDILNVIAEYLVDGINDLFVYHDNTQEFYILSSPGKPDLVTGYELQDAQLESGKEVKIRSNKYIGLLKYHMADAPSLHSRINKMEFSQKNLVDISKEYHGLVCTTGEECIIYEKTGIHSLSLIAPHVSVDLTAVKFFPERELETISLPFSIGYSAGGVVNFPLYRGGHAIDLQVNLFYSNRCAAGKYIEVTGYDGIINNLEYHYYSIGMAPNVRFQFRSKKLAYLISVGPTVRLAINQEMKNTVEYVSDPNNPEIREYSYVIEKKSGVGGIKSALGILIPIKNKSMLQLSLNYNLQFGTIYLPKISTIFIGDYFIKEQVLAMETTIYF